MINFSDIYEGYKRNEDSILKLIGTAGFLILGCKLGYSPFSSPSGLFFTAKEPASTKTSTSYSYNGLDPVLGAATSFYNSAVTMKEPWDRYKQAQRIFDLAKSAQLTNSSKGTIIFLLDKMGQAERDVWYKGKISDLVTRIIALPVKKGETDDA